MKTIRLHGALPSLALSTCLLGFAPMAVGHEADQEEGTLIQIGPDEPAARQPPPLQGGPAVAVSQYWIGVIGGPLTPELKAHVVLRDGQGVLVRTVEPNSPAQQAGVRQHDILTRVNGKPLNSIRELAEQVGEQGEMKGRLAIELTRAGRSETVWVTPEQRPAKVNPFAPLLQRGGVGPMPEMRLQQMRGGVAITLRSQGDGPAQITVRKGEQTWQFDSDDARAIAELPDDVRPEVERLLTRQNRLGGGIVFRGNRLFGDGPVDPFGGMPFDQEFQRAEERVQQMIEPFRQQFPPGVVPGKAPPPEEAAGEPVDIEIPAE